MRAGELPKYTEEPDGDFADLRPQTLLNRGKDTEHRSASGISVVHGSYSPTRAPPKFIPLVQYAEQSVAPSRPRGAG